MLLYDQHVIECHLTWVETYSATQL